MSTYYGKNSQVQLLRVGRQADNPLYYRSNHFLFIVESIENFPNQKRYGLKLVFKHEFRFLSLYTETF